MTLTQLQLMTARRRLRAQRAKASADALVRLLLNVSLPLTQSVVREARAQAARAVTGGGVVS